MSIPVPCIPETTAVFIFVIVDTCYIATMREAFFVVVFFFRPRGQGG